MRLSTKQREIIKDIVVSYFKNAKVYLFGSRVDDKKRGGDIDLYLELPSKPHFLDKPRLVAALKRALGEQKIDLVFHYPNKKETLIDKEAKQKRVLL